ncbi:YafY family protein [Janibacter alkaliphilus]|uniref:Putative DNA-binding transcriptional regulator YafY n=1 Tax=Janibacter alkaliphilus TaxID=1069963 RepID=A0A852X407_9MICO|nr:WYL domain-containing protein [Janibacter alkaliphilus]NYG37629.1 putative DNA-binding transcriptional regulator YafY [Janibacter alkaliphilus]
MRADRLVSLVLLLRQRGLTSATALAAELEVTTRTIQRDVEALSAAGVPVYAERGPLGGYALLPGFRAELTGLTDDQAVAVLAAGSGRALGLGGAHAAALRKVLDALPEERRGGAREAARRILVAPETDLLARPVLPPEIPAEVLVEVRRAVLDGRQLRLRYARPGRAATWRTVEPVGLVVAGERSYLLATAAGEDRTYRLSRVQAAEALAEPAERAEEIDLPALWRERSERFRGEDTLTVVVRVREERRAQLVGSAVALVAERPDGGDRIGSPRDDHEQSPGWTTLELTFQDERHADWALWRLGDEAEVLLPEALRARLRERALRLAAALA